MEKGRFLRYYIPSLVLIVLWFIMLFLVDILEGDIAGALAALWLFVVTPGIIIGLVWAIKQTIQDVKFYKSNGFYDVQEPFIGGDNVITRSVSKFKGIKDMDSDVRIRFLTIWIGGIVIACFGFIVAVNNISNEYGIVAGIVIAIGGIIVCSKAAK